VVVTEKAAAVYQRGHWLVSNVSDVRIMWNITTRQPFPEETANHARTYGELVHMDLWGPAQTESVAGHLYYISFTNDFS
jgi:hypothetical protein